MKKGYLSQYFKGVAIKKLSAVETDFKRSHQHEFNGVSDLKNLFGKPENSIQIATNFLYLCDDDYDPVRDEGCLTWYDARSKARKERGIERSEYRLYYKCESNLVMLCAAENDLLVIALKPDGSVLVVIAEGESTISRQIQWLFGAGVETHPGFSVRSEMETEQDRLTFAARTILEYIGIEWLEEDTSFLEQMLSVFQGKFPSTRKFSEFTRAIVKDINAIDDPDSAIMAWMEKEEIMFRTLEKHLLSEQFQQIGLGVGSNSDQVISIVQSALQRRKSRAGSALENHIEEVFCQHNVSYSRGAVTEVRRKPDFIMPNIEFYHNKDFPQYGLTMLASKATCKDRWRQILNEAQRIEQKHLLTLEPSISQNQTDEMQEHKVQLVIPVALHQTYLNVQRAQLMSVYEFLELVKYRQCDIALM